MKSSVIIFLEDAAIRLAEKKPNNVQSIFIRSSSDMQRFLDRFLSANMLDDITLLGNNIEVLYEDFKRYFNYTEAAGGLVKNAKGEYLLIKRYDTWDLPKGKIKKNENSEEGAMREVQEETSVSDLFIMKVLQPTFHIYLHHEKYILKKTHWFLMNTKFDGVLVPQTAEDITEAVWMSKKNSYKALSAGYRSIKDILTPYLV